ncbi:MAG TPA: hypothetical protein VNM67_05900 [Thermoanaerobaculia bacterium]|jgi:hypothetical protein|nr:hypothetical protein [Thermoanaerobaculia bacterium]
MPYLFFRELFQTFLGDYLKIVEPDTAVHLLPEQARFPAVDMSDWTDEERNEIGAVAEIPTRDGGSLTLLIQFEPELRGPAETARRFGRWFLALETRMVQPVLLSVLYLRGGRPGPNLESAAVSTVYDMEVVRIFYTAFGLSEAHGDYYLERPEPLAWALAALMKPVRRSRAEHRLACLRRIADSNTVLSDRERSLLTTCVEQETEPGGPFCVDALRREWTSAPSGGRKGFVKGGHSTC